MKTDQQHTPIIAGIGEILWDVLEDSEELGGAPINFAYHAGALGADSHAISTIGDDDRGRRAIKELQKRHMPTDHITVKKGSTTGYVLARVDENGVATCSFPDNVAWDNLEFNDQSWVLAEKLDAVCFGTLAQRSDISRQTIHYYLDKVQHRALKVLDLNLRQQFYTENIIRSSLSYANVLKLNDDEIVKIAQMENLTGSVEQQLQALVNRYSLQLAVLTRGGEGSLLVSSSEMSNHPGYPTDIIDTIGAGDSFTATTILGLLKGYPLDKINDLANRVAAFVCSQKGAMPQLPEQYRLC